MKNAPFGGKPSMESGQLPAPNLSRFAVVHVHRSQSLLFLRRPFFATLLLRRAGWQGLRIAFQVLALRQRKRHFFPEIQSALDLDELIVELPRFHFASLQGSFFLHVGEEVI